MQIINMKEKKFLINDDVDLLSFNEDDNSSRGSNTESDFISKEEPTSKSIDGKPHKCRERVNKIKLCLRLISVGKYEMKLYHRGSEDLSSSFGGILTIIVFLIVCFFAFQNINDIQSKIEYTLNQ